MPVWRNERVHCFPRSSFARLSSDVLCRLKGDFFLPSALGVLVSYQQKNAMKGELFFGRVKEVPFDSVRFIFFDSCDQLKSIHRPSNQILLGSGSIVVEPFSLRWTLVVEPCYAEFILVQNALVNKKNKLARVIYLWK